MSKPLTPDDLARSGSEDGEQTALFCFARSPGYAQAGPHAALWRLLFAIPNGGARSPATAARMKATGTRAGVPDICLPTARGGFFGLYIELKRQKIGKRRAGVVSDEQSSFGTQLSEQNYLVVVCHGWKDAVEIIDRYLDMAQTSSVDALGFLSIEQQGTVH